ncbi:hypothetical protein [Paraburkholderia tropica]|uniref:hypothetical protein n=1 Tax=Paraburkholderia tropica TaxID=92647 RepID=UPI002E18551B
MESKPLPEFRDIRWRWIAYASSAFVVVALVLAFTHEVELKQDVRCEIVSPAEIKIQGETGWSRRSTSSRPRVSLPVSRCSVSNATCRSPTTARAARHSTHRCATKSAAPRTRSTRNDVST